MKTAAVALACLGTIAVAAQQQTPPADQRPPVTFRAEINYVEIDAIVTDRNGRFVSGLTRDDFQIIEEGKPQAIASFDLVHIPIERMPRITAADSIDSGAVTNREPFNGRLFLLLLDDLHTDVSRTTYVRKAARDFIDRHAAANDLVAVSFTSGRSMGQDFTASRAALLAAIDRFTGNKLRSATAAMIEDRESQRYVMETASSLPKPGDRDPLELQRMMRAKASLNVLEQMSDFLGGIRGRRKALVYVGEGVDNELIDVVSVDASTVQRDTAGVREAMRDAVAAATRSNVSVYTIDPRGFATATEDFIGTPTQSPTDFRAPATVMMGNELSRAHLWMRAVAEQTGGIPFLNTNDTAGPLRRIVEDSSSYYILGYYAPAGRKDGRFRTVDVRVTRPGLEVRARKGYHAPRNTARPAAARPNTRASEPLLDALRSPLPLTGLRFAASVSAFQGKPPLSTAVLVIEVEPGQLAFTPRGSSLNTDVELYVSATDPLAKASSQAVHHLAELRLRPDTHETVTREGIRFTRRLDLLPGRYRLQIGVRDKTSGATGTVFTDLEVPDFFKNPLQISDLLVVSAARKDVPTPERDPAFGALLQAPQTAHREFSRSDTLAVFAEIYDNDLSTPHRVSATTTVIDEDGRVVFSATDEHASADLIAPAGAQRVTPASGGWGHRVTMALAEFGTGRFILRVEAARRSASHAPVKREIVFWIR